MNDLISRQAAIDALESIGSLDTNADREYARSVFETLPSAQPERKNGKWLQKEDPFGFFEEIPVCSECGHTTEMRRTYNFCPHCGARMEVEE